MNKHLRKHPRSGYAFLPGIAPYSSGVIATAGYEIVHVSLQYMMPWQEGLQAAGLWLESHGLVRSNLCAVELRCPAPYSPDGFAEFNSRYQTLLEEWKMLIDGQNPVARTNVAPLAGPPKETQLFGFSFVQSAQTSLRTFVVAGAGELPHRDVEQRHIVRLGETSPEAMQHKAACVLRIIRKRLECLDAIDSTTSMINVYTAHPLQPILVDAIIPAIPAAGRLGIRWFCSRPPVQEIEFEMDVRGVRQELTVEL